MTRKLFMGRTRALMASLVLAGAAISGTSASAQFGDPECGQAVYEECTTEWQAWGYRNVEDCQRLEPCYYCYYGYLCGYSDYWAPGKPRED